MSKKLLVGACFCLLVLCIVQQWIIRSHGTPVASDRDSRPPPAETWDVRLLNMRMVPPPGAIGDDMQLNATTYGNTGFEACL